MGNITCEFTGRHGDDIKVTGASSAEEAREAALQFMKEEGDPEGITLDDGYHSTWPYDEPQPVDWVDSYVFRSMDSEPLPAEYYNY